MQAGIISKAEWISIIPKAEWMFASMIPKAEWMHEHQLA
jgi:hypothetical protein